MRLLFAFLVVTVALVHTTPARADVSSLTSEQRKINLEDIERDTLLNEIRSKSQETLHAEPTEHIPPTAVSSGPGPVQHVQHVQHTGPTAASQTGPGSGAVSHQTIVYHQNAGHPHQQHQQTYSHDGPQPTAAPANFHSGITYAQAQQEYHQQPTGPAPTPFHYSHSAPAAAPQAAHFVQQQAIHGQPPHLLSQQPVVYYSHHAHYPQEPVQYVTIQQQQPHISQIAANFIAPPVPQVHEEGRTYSAPSRHTLELATQQQKLFKSQPPQRTPLVGFRPKPNLITPQPQYVYVQANNVASAQQQRQYQQKFQPQQQQQQAPQQLQQQKTQNVEIIPSQGHEITAPVEYVPQQSGVTYAQSTPYFQYSGTFGHPQAVPAHSSLPVNNYVVVPYATQPNVYHPHHHQQQAPAPTPAQLHQAPAPVIQEIPHYVNPTKTIIPNGPPQVFIQPQHHSYVHSAPQPHPYHSHAPAYPTVSYAPSHPFGGHGHHSYNNYYQPTLDFFGPYARHTSLINSYVPSNLIYSKSRQHYQQYYGGPTVAPVPQAPQFHHQPQYETDSAYNTIAYSTEQKPVVVPPPSPTSSSSAAAAKAASSITKRESTVLRAAPKPVTVTKIENVKVTSKKN